MSADSLWPLAALPGILVVLFWGVGAIRRLWMQRALARQDDQTPTQAAVVIAPEGRRASGDPDQEFAAGSITKGFTGLLLADAIDRGELSAEQPLGELLDLGDSAAGSVTLGALAQHRSGLPALTGTTGGDTLGTLRHFRGTNPYVWEREDVLDLARAAKVGRGRFAYSNLGAALVGHAVASAAGSTYEDLLQERILGPLGMSSSRVATAELPYPPGKTRLGRPVEPWVLRGFAPAGGLATTTADLQTFIEAALAGAVPGQSAMDEQGDGGMGFFWMREKDGLVWHNGQVGGYFSTLAIDRSRGRGAAALNARQVNITDWTKRLARRG